MLARFEQLVEGAVEGGLRRLFPTTLQPVQLAKAAARAMEDAQVIGLYGADVPNEYRVRLAPVDFERFATYQSRLASELSRYLVDYAAERGLRPIASPHVQLVSDADVRVGTVKADATFVDLPAERRDDIQAAVEGTRRLRLADLAGARADAAPEPSANSNVWLKDRFGLNFELDRDAGLVRLGRASDNDVPIANQRVSRYHAQLRRVESTWLLYDLDSTNGTFVDDQRVFPSQPHAIAPGARIRLGDHDIEAVQTGPA